MGWRSFPFLWTISCEGDILFVDGEFVSSNCRVILFATILLRFLEYITFFSILLC